MVANRLSLIPLKLTRSLSLLINIPIMMVINSRKTTILVIEIVEKKANKRKKPKTPPKPERA